MSMRWEWSEYDWSVSELRSAVRIQRVYRGHRARKLPPRLIDLMRTAGPTFRISWRLDRIRKEMESLGFKVA